MTKFQTFCMNFFHRLITHQNPKINSGQIFFYICCILKSWVHAIFSHYRTVSLQLGDNYASKCSSDNFPHTKYTSTCVENCQNYIAMHRWSSIAGRTFPGEGTNLSNSFPCSSNLLPRIGEQLNIKVWF